MLIEFCSLTEHAVEEKWVRYENLVFKYGDIEHKRAVKPLLHQYLLSEETDNAGMYC